MFTYGNKRLFTFSRETWDFSGVTLLGNLVDSTHVWSPPSIMTRGINDFSLALAFRLETSFGRVNIAFCRRLAVTDRSEVELCGIDYLVRLLELLESHGTVKEG